MAIELPHVLKNMNLFVDGRGYAGRVDEIKLPKLTGLNGCIDIPCNLVQCTPNTNQVTNNCRLKKNRGMARSFSVI